MSKRSAAIAAITLACIVAAFVVPPIAQPLRYHAFADHRPLMGIANFGDVATNAAFLVAAVAGLAVVFRRRSAFERSVERCPYAVFFAGLALTAVGSSYYHLAPDNARLFWDRMPITIAFAGLVAGQIADRISVRASLALLVPMIVAGVASVAYWRATEMAGQGNLVPYGAVQGYTMIVLILIASLWPSRYTRGRDLLYVIGWYALAKVCETLDHRIFDLGHVISGHTLKHVFGSLSGVAVCVMLAKRVPLSPGGAAVLESRAAVA